MIRYEKANSAGIRVAVHYFPTDPFSLSSGMGAVKHLLTASKHLRHKCHDDNDVRKYSHPETTKHAYEGMCHCSVKPLVRC